ncbi:Doubled CXXCH motif (Paired_CXXCH_1) [Tsuneonella dongtanensis]|uniref:Doubled CXXCH motif (Paired_CXXCH_1) n=1 Tax=Tsuneonella dongtanensis TaxID=692370 RepID=A0A1B2A8U7_9SPHN|nr:cytochrome c3 family protein [Tsuneonella dongtanensis]ANY18589.1 Doubled CXXCH motif (Paired_CXXCH_1) [Tsuneonella dongtanensis]
MTFRLRQIQTTAAGREIVRERTVDGERLTIGRSAENDVAIPDLAVEQHHVIVTAQGRSLTFEAAGTLGFTLDGRKRTAETIDDGGAELILGSYRIDFAAGPDGEFEVTVRSQEERESGEGLGTHGFRLANTWLPSKRPVAWTLLIAIFLAFLVVPIWSHINREPVKPDYRKPGQVAMDASWSTGKLSLAHRGLEDNCEACHAKPFVAVRDDTCLTCHEKIGDHSAKPRLTLARGPLSWGDQVQRDIADVFHKPGAGACTDCHTEHEGEGRMEPPAQKFCADCHGTMDKRIKTPLGNAHDFGKGHPQFQAAVLTVPGAEKATRLSLDTKPKEFNGLKFPHAMHLSKGGGVAQMARRLGAGKGYGAPLECADCHTPTSDGVRFREIDMETSCGTCHSLVFDKVGGTFRTLRHGDIDQMRADLAAADRVPRRPIASGRKRPGEFAPGGLYYGNFAPPQASSVPLASRVLSTRGVCTECHFPSGSGVMEVVQPKRYIANGWFDHEPHKREKCTTCHAAPTSSSATDVLLPGIKTCRTCHLGEDAAKPKVPSSCAMCHSYHPRGELAPVRVGKDAADRKTKT